MQARRIWEYSGMAVFAAAILALQYTVQRPDIGDPWIQGFWWMGMLLLVAVMGYAGLLRLPDDSSRHNALLTLGVLLRAAMVMSAPLLSDDFYRYVWDGRVLLSGGNPYDFTPTDWPLRTQEVENWRYLYDQLNSKGYYSVYPPFLQGIFAVSTWIGGQNTEDTAMAMKAFVVMAEMGSLWLLDKIATRLGFSRKAVLVYALNPLVILELSGNLHTEAFMIFFLLAAVWALMNARWWVAAPLLTLAIASKLLPVLAFPYLWRRMRRRDFFLLSGVAIALTAGLFYAFLRHGQLSHFLASIQLYFHYFEFNSGLHYFVRGVGGGGVWHIFSQILPFALGAFLLGYAWRERKPDWSNLPVALLIALTAYQLHSPVIHPWYLTPLVALAGLTRYRFATVWSCLIPFTYIAYFYPGIQEQYWVIWVEYLVLLGVMVYEWQFVRPRRNLAEWLRDTPAVQALVRKTIPARLRIKQARIARHLHAGERILDIGAGHGGLCRALRAEGFNITTVDVQDLSLFPDVKPVIYNGEQLPFNNGSFDTSLLITMLHHTPQPDAVLEEARRVTNGRLVIMEDIYRNALQRELTFFMDSLVNFEFEGHPHTNKTDAEWQALFETMRLKLVYREEFRTLLFFTQVIYVLERQR